MAFLATTLGSPTLCIRGNVQYEKQYLIPDSGKYNFSSSSDNNWSFPNSLRFQSERIKGIYSLEDNFEQGYFNFENWTGRTVYSSDLAKSGYQSVMSSGLSPFLVNFWGRGDSAVGADSMYNYGFNGTAVCPKNITTACVMSGVNTGTTNPNSYPNLKMYIGSIPSGNVTVYGRVGSVNPAYRWNDRILSFNVPETISGGGGVSTSTAYTFPGTGADEASIGTDTWGSTSSIVSDDGNGAVVLIMGSASHYLLGTNYGFSLSGMTIDSVEVVVDIQAASSLSENAVRLFYAGSPIGDNKSTGAALSVGTKTYTWTSAQIGSLTAAQISESSFGFAYSVTGGFASATIDYFKIKITYTTPAVDVGTGLSGNLSLYNVGDISERKLKWIATGFGDDLYVNLPSHTVTCQEFSNFLMTYSRSTGLGYFYTAYDDEPFQLENVVDLGDITQVFNGETIFYENSYATAAGNIINNPKILTDFAISNRAWGSTEISEFDHRRLNPAYWIDDDPTSSRPSPSGSDTKSLNFHFPVNSSGLLGSCDSTNARALSYYVPLSSGVNDRLFEFDRSQFNPTALSLDMWASNTGTNPSGNLGARIDFCNVSGFFSRDLYTPTHYWSGFSVQVPSGISQIRMSGLVYTSSHSLSDLTEVSRARANNAQLFMGSWYDNIHRTYNGDIKVYSARVGLDGFVSPARASGQIDLYCSGEQKSTARMDLFLQNSHISNSIDLYLNGHESADNSIPLYISGGFAQNSIDLFIGGQERASGQMDLYIAGSTEYASMPLFLYSAPASQASGDLSLFMWATTHSGSSNSMTMFIGENAPSGVQSASMNLFTQGPFSERVTSSMNLFLDSDAPVESNSMTLFLGNYYTGSSGSMTLFLKSKSGTLGAIPASASMNLFLNRETESVAHNIPLFISGPGSSTGGMDLSITGANKSNGQIPLYTDGIGVVKGTMKLFTHGF